MAWNRCYHEPEWATTWGIISRRQLPIRRLCPYNPRNRSISGVSEGEADLHVAVGAARERVHVFVRPPVNLDSGTIVIEPSTGSLAVGEAQDLHVILETDDGRRIDRTSSAIVQSGDRNVLAVRGTRVVGLTPGRCEVTASLPGIASTGGAVFVVENVDFTAIEISPPSMHLAWGEERPIRIYGNGPSGRRDLTYHPDIRVNYGGNTPDAIQWQAGTATVRGAAPGEAELRVTWRDLVADPVPIEVSGTAHQQNFRSNRDKRPPKLVGESPSSCSPHKGTDRETSRQTMVSSCRLLIPPLLGEAEISRWWGPALGPRK